MDDDEFGGFEAAESFEDGEMGTQSISPAIPWAAFSAGPGVELTQSSSADVIVVQPAQSVENYTSKPALFPENESDSTLGVESGEKAFVEQVVSTEKGKHVQPSVDIASVPTNSQEIDPQQSASADVLVGHMVPKETNKMEAHYKESLENMEAKLSAAEEEKLRIKEELQEMFEKYSKLEEHLQEKKTEEISYEDHYNQLQEKHKLELEDLRKAGHDALSVIIEEFKALTKSAVQQQQEASRKQLHSAIENQMQKCEELLNTQHERLLDSLEKEKSVLQEKIKEALEEQKEQHKDALERCVAEERLRSTEAMGKVVKAEKEIITEAVLKAVQEERERMEKIQLEKRELWEIERSKDQEKLRQAIQEALQEERKKGQEAIREAANQEGRRSEKAIEEAIQKTREDMIKYTKEQKRVQRIILLARRKIYFLEMMAVYLAS
ncbi:coiled-coil domain-containing protein 91-like isoform X2 [Scyliorhinus canicula]|uniref:coiled-coil domain-containing protein 91-like isoform X2 n=1 Tax=Scyliorhinus canicula TaxID=7830 RepID=UPI0018F471AC|nr:coiled-coil domain-containing protein 91-like isoform X2 [Scyliorhinus canicula]